MGLLHWIMNLLSFKQRKQQERQKMVQSLSQSILDWHQEESRPVLIDTLKNQPQEVLDYINSELEELLVIYCWRENRMIMIPDYEALIKEIFDHLKHELLIDKAPI